MKIGIDIDNVCVNTTEAMLDYINARLPVNLKPSDITTYSIESALPQQYKWIVESGFRDKEMWKGVKMVDGCAEAIERLYADGHDIYFVTSSLPENLRKKINHLARNIKLPEGFVEKHTINIQDKSLLGIDVLIDDCLWQALPELRDKKSDRHYLSIIFDYPWNQTKEDTAYSARASNWQEAYDVIAHTTHLKPLIDAYEEWRYGAD